MKEKGFAYVDQGALVVDVKEENDTKEIPPCMLLKSDGASLYTTTDLATIVERMKLFNPDEILYVVDKRQELHFIQVFRCARKTGLVKDDTKLSFLGFGTMNGKDGKPFKTREGGVMRLETLIKDINEEMFTKIVENRSVKDKDAKETGFPRSNTVTFPIRLPRITFLILTDLHHLKVIQVRISFIRSFVSNLF